MPELYQPAFLKIVAFNFDIHKVKTFLKWPIILGSSRNLTVYHLYT